MRTVVLILAFLTPMPIWLWVGIVIWYIVSCMIYDIEVLAGVKTHLGP